MRRGFHDFFRQWPFVPLVACLAAGIVASRTAGLEIFTSIVLLCGALVALVVPKMRWVGVFAGLFALGAAVYSARYEILDENDLRLVLGGKAALVTIRGRLRETPGLREYPGQTNTQPSTYARIELAQVLLQKEWRPASGFIAATGRGVLSPEFFKGRQVEVTGVLSEPAKAQAPGMFDFRQYLYNSRIFYQFRCEGTNDWRLLSLEPLPLTERFQRWAHAQLGRGLPDKDEPLEMVRAMALGTNQSLNGEVADVFMRTGTMHIFAISGLHVACIAGCILFVLRSIAGVPRDQSALILIPLVWFYTLATGWQSSAVRSALMSTFVFAGWAIRRPTQLLNSTAAAAFLILLLQPEQLFQASFQLSFSVVAAIAVILGMERDGEPWTLIFQNRLLGYDPLLLPELHPQWKRWLEVPLAFFLGNLAISGASWIGSSPLTAYYFNVVTPISLLANLVAVPLSSISLACTLGSLLVPPLGPVFNYLSWATMWETIAVARWLSKISWGYFYVPKPNLWFFLAYFGLCLVWAIPSIRRGRASSLALLAAGAAVLAWVCSLWTPARSTNLTMLPVLGTPLVVDEPGRSGDVLIDCSNARGAEKLLKRFLHAQGFGSIRQVVVTQPDAAHAGGLPSIVTNFSPQAVFTSGVRGRSRVYRDAIYEAERTPGLLHDVSAGEERIGWQVLYPSAGQTLSRAPDNAMVLRRVIHGWSVLSLSNLGRLGQRRLLERGDGLSADIVLSGTAEEIDPELLRAIAPRLIVLGTVESPFNRSNRRRRSSGFSGSSARVVKMEDEAAVVLRISAGQCEVETARERFAIER